MCCADYDMEPELIQAAKEGDIERMAELLGSGVDINVRNRTNMTALGAALLFDQTEAAEFLISAGADVNIADDSGDTSVHMACCLSKGSASMVKILLKAGAYADPLNFSGYTPLYIAASYGKVEATRILAVAGADPLRKNWNGETPAEKLKMKYPKKYDKHIREILLIAKQIKETE